jgi:hypothetical protein
MVNPWTNFILVCAFGFFSFQFCDVAQVHITPLLAKFGYKQHVKVRKLCIF